MTGMAVTNSAAKNATSAATYPFGVHWYRMFENSTAETIPNCTHFHRICFIPFYL